MELILLRHGIAVDREDPLCPPDFERPLTDKGRRRTAAALRGLARLGVRPQAVATSPLIRARQTAELAAEVLEPEDSEVRVVAALEPFGSPESVLSAVLAMECDSVLCAGHAPNLDLVLARAVGASPFTRLKKAGVACVELDARSGPGRLVWLYEPRSLRAIDSAEWVASAGSSELQ